MRHRRPFGRAFLTVLGPGLVSGAADTDPTTVATLAVVGATTGYRLAWQTLLLLPMLATIQIISARLGVICGESLQQLSRRRYGVQVGLLLAVSVLVVNLVTLAADVEAAAAGLGLLCSLPWRLFVAPVVLLVLGLLWLGSYEWVERTLTCVLLLFAAYIGAAILAHPNWVHILRETLLPPLSLDRPYIEGALAILGTTLTSYVYIWLTIAQAERRDAARRVAPAQAEAAFGMLCSVAVFWFILVGTGATLGQQQRSVQTAQDAAAALQPVAGHVAATLFAVGLCASAALALPIIAATSGYVLAQQYGWPSGLSLRPRQATRFYAIIAGVTLLAGIVALIGVPPIRLLFWASLAGGIATPVGLALLLLLARDRAVMGSQRIGRRLAAIGWGTTALVTIVGVFFLGQQLARLA
jgi:Mn2+/Fe2+ NRAMP family transporter